MKTKILQLHIVISILAISSLYSINAEAQEHIFTKSIYKSIYIANKSIIIDTEKANIDIEEALGNELILEIKFISKNNDKIIAEQQLDFFNHLINIKSKEIYIRSFILIPANNELTGSIYTHYTLKIPRNKNIQITNTLGDISLTSIKGNFSIHSKYGKINIDNLDGNLQVDAEVGEIIIKDSQQKSNINTKYMNSYFYNCRGEYSIKTNLGALNFSINNNISSLNIDATGTEIIVSNKHCKEYNLSLTSTNANIFIDDCLIIDKKFIKTDSRNTMKEKQEFEYTNPNINQNICIRNKYANISLQ